MSQHYAAADASLASHRPKRSTCRKTGYAGLRHLTDQGHRVTHVGHCVTHGCHVVTLGRHDPGGNDVVLVRECSYPVLI